MNKKQLKQTVEAYSNVTRFNINDKGRLGPTVMRKAALMTALHQEASMTDQEIADVFGNERTTVLHHRKNHVGNYMVDFYKNCYDQAYRIIRNVIPNPKTVEAPMRSDIISVKLKEMQDYFSRVNIIRYVENCEFVIDYIKDLETQIIIKDDN